ncbi:Asp-tRNA(Asn)/Glu-tRNA(Gln) amidotransferase subunit GatA [Candidatus Falkowbacteria bacterium]|nr:Asp-tRNA(Asn)/Glu-tRNA(Gln) amidotransferase subunit GatA [Candidatus Falkowbacteria bacterium]
MNLNELTIKAARIKLDKGEISAQDLTRACLLAIEEKNKELNACLLVSQREAMLEAKAADKRLVAGEKGGLLGIPYLCKDNLMTKGLKTTAASKMLVDYIASYDATVIAQLKKAGAILLGKTNLDEFAHGASTETSAFGVTKNPHDLSRVAGGSSGGSAAAVAANLCLFALGSDTGGSIRQPASFCGVIGFKPSYGLVSRFGLLSMTSSTDVIGPLTKTVADAKIVLDFLSGGDQRDATSVSYNYVAEMKKALPRVSPRLAKTATEKDLKKSIKGLKIGLPQEYFATDLAPDIKKVIDEKIKMLKDQGAQLIDISLPYSKYGISAYYIITPCEISSNLARFDGVGWGNVQVKTNSLQDFYQVNRGLGFGDETKRRIMLGTYALSAGYYDAYYKKAQAVRTLIIADFNQAFSKVDFILTPTSPHAAFKIGEQNNDPLTMYLEDVFVTGASLAGLPAISVPAGEVPVSDDKNMPVGLQLLAPRFFDKELFYLAQKVVK